MAFLDFIFDPGKPYRKAREDVIHGYEIGKGAYQPYMQYGQQAGGTLADMMARLSKPQQFEEEMMSGYQQSPLAQQRLARNLDEGQTIAQAMGLGGSGAALRDIQQGASNIMNQDEQEYRNRMMQDYMAAMGLGQSLYGTGAQSAGNFANMANQAYGRASDAAYGAQAAPGMMMGSIGNMLMSLALAPTSGGGSLLSNYMNPGIAGGR